MIFLWCSPTPSSIFFIHWALLCGFRYEIWRREVRGKKSISFSKSWLIIKKSILILHTNYPRYHPNFLLKKNMFGIYRFSYRISRVNKGISLFPPLYKPISLSCGLYMLFGEEELILQRYSLSSSLWVDMVNPFSAMIMLYCSAPLVSNKAWDFSINLFIKQSRGGPIMMVLLFHIKEVMSSSIKMTGNCRCIRHIWGI